VVNGRRARSAQYFSTLSVHGLASLERQRRDEVPIDVDDVALGHQTKMRGNDREQWVWSDEPTHESLVSIEHFAAAQLVFQSAASQRAARRLIPRSANLWSASRLVLPCFIMPRHSHVADQLSWNETTPRVRKHQLRADLSAATILDHDASGRPHPLTLDVAGLTAHYRFVAARIRRYIHCATR
jgi:hypothetical protein